MHGRRWGLGAFQYILGAYLSIVDIALGCAFHGVVFSFVLWKPPTIVPDGHDNKDGNIILDIR